MSVIVKGMKMPKNCFYCAMSSFGVCNIAVRIWDISTRPDWCPLAGLPEGYGRLIEADNLKETLDYYIREAGWDEKTNRVLGWVKD